MSKFNEILTNVEDWIAGTLIISASMLTFINVVLRYVFKSPLNWGGELVRFMIVWAAFIGSAIALRKGAHIRVSILTNLLNKRIRRLVVIFANTVGFLFSIFCIWQGTVLVLDVLEKGQKTINMGVSMTWLYAAMPVGCIFLAVRFLQMIHETIYDFDGVLNKGEH